MAGVFKVKRRIITQMKVGSAMRERSSGLSLPKTRQIIRGKKSVDLICEHKQRKAQRKDQIWSRNDIHSSNGRVR